MLRPQPVRNGRSKQKEGMFMASSQTTNYGLNQWAAEDQVLRNEFNQDNIKLDTALKQCGNCRIYTGSYVGTGTYGIEEKSLLTFPFKPLVVFISSKRADSPLQYAMAICDQLKFCHLAAQSHLGNFSYCTWTETSLSWYSTYDANAQMNSNDVEYLYVAIGC